MTDRVIGYGAHVWQHAATDPAAAGADQTLVAAPASPRRIYLDCVVISCDGPAVVKISEGNDSTTTRLLYSQLGAAGQHVISFPSDRPLRLAVGSALKVTVTGANWASTVYYDTAE